MLIDTNVAIHLRDNDPTVVARLAATPVQVSVSLVTLIELEGGVTGDASRMAARRRGLDRLVARTKLIALDQPVVDAYADIVRHAGFSRRRILDRLIAATAIVHALPLVTINGDDFRDIPGLTLEIWPTAQ